MNLPDSSREALENKLIILYIMESLGMPSTNRQISRLIMEFRLMNYILMQQSFSELLSSNFINAGQVDGKTYYTLTEAGKRTLASLAYKIPSGIKSAIGSSINTHRRNIRDELLVTADCIPVDENRYSVACKVIEGDFTLIEISIAVGTRSDALAVCENWEKNAQTIYSEIIEAMVKKRD